MLGRLLTRKDNHRNVMISVFNNGYTISMLLFLAGSIGSFCDAVVASMVLGISELAAIGLVYPYTKFMECISLVFSAGSQVIISRKIGKNKFDEVSAVFFTSLIVLTVTGILLAAIVMSVAESLSVLFGASGIGNTLKPTTDYLKSLAVGAPAYLLTLYLIPLFQLDGKKKFINITTIAMTCVNIILNITFVYCGFGISGIGYSTSISYYFALLLLSTHFLEKKKGFLLQGGFRPVGTYLREIVREGFPVAFKNITSIIYNICLNNLIAQVGSTIALAAFSTYKMTKFIFLSVTESIINPVRMLQSMLYEEKDTKLLRLIFRHAVSIALISSVSISLIIWVFGRQLYSLLVSGAVLNETVSLINYAAVQLILNTFVCYYIAYFQAINKNRLVYSISFVLNIVSLPYTYMLAHAYGITGVWMSLVLQFIVTAVYVISCAYYMGRSNRRMIDKLLVLPERTEEYQTYDYHITSMEDVEAGLEDFTVICENNMKDRKKAYYLCLAFEEIICNILEYERTVSKEKSNINVHILVHDHNRILIRIKDYSRERNPFVKYEYTSARDNLENLGIRMIKSFAEDIKYSYIYNINFITIKI